MILVRSEDFAACLNDGKPPEAVKICRLAPGDAFSTVDTGGITLAEVSNQGVGRDLNVIMTDGWVLEPFQANPVIPFAHDTEAPPVAKATDIYKTRDKRLMMTVEWAPTAMGQMLKELYAKRFMRGWSTGWIAGEFEYSRDPGRKGGITFLRGHELLETSAVVVPSLRSALSRSLADAQSAGIDTRPLCEFAEEKLDSWSKHLPVTGIMRRSDVEELWTAAKMPSSRIRAGKMLSSQNETALRQAHQQISSGADQVKAVCDRAAGAADADADDPAIDAAVEARLQHARQLRGRYLGEKNRRQMAEIRRSEFLGGA